MTDSALIFVPPVPPPTKRDNGTNSLLDGTNGGTPSGTNSLKLNIINRMLRDRARDTSGTASNNHCPTPSQPSGQQAGQAESLQERAGVLLANGLPRDHVDGLALALSLVESFPQAEAALCWLIDSRNREIDSHV